MSIIQKKSRLFGCDTLHGPLHKQSAVRRPTRAGLPGVPFDGGRTLRSLVSARHFRYRLKMIHRYHLGFICATASALCQAGTTTPTPVGVTFVFEAKVNVEKPLVIGQSSHGLRRVVPISGGTVNGPALKGSVVPGGADWQFLRPDGVLEVQAKYTLKADDGTLIMVDNRGVRHASAAVMERMTKGEQVAASEYYFRTSAQFEAPAGSKYEWLNRAVFVGVAERLPDAAVIRFYKVD